MRKAALFILWFIVWILLTWPSSVYDAVMAFIVSAIVCIMTLDTLGQSYGGTYTPALRREGLAANLARPFWFLLYIVVFVWECMKANVDVAYRVVHPDLPIRPGTIKVKVGLKSDIGLTFLANSITLTPGTTTVDVDKEHGYIYIHWLYVREDYDPAGRGLPVVERFEKIVQRIFE